MKLRLSSVFWDRFAKASVGLAGIFIATLGMPNALAYVLSHKLLVALSYVTAEAALFGTVWFSGRGALEQPKPPFRAHALQKVRMEIRFGAAADFAGMDRIYDSSLDAEMAMDDGDFRELLTRGNLMRVMEEDFISGSERIKRISGYYSLWPLRTAEFDRIVEGELREEDLKPSDIPDLSDPEVAVLYLSEVCVSDDADSGATLMRDMLRYIARLLALYPNIESIAAWPYSEDGKEWVRELKLMPCRRQWRGRRIYALNRRAALASSHLPSGQFKERLIVNY